MAELTLHWSPNGEDYLGIVDARVLSGDFTGRGSAWFDRRRLKTSFIDPIRDYPLSVARPPRMESQLWDKDRGVLQIAVTPFDSRGTLLVQVDLGADLQAGAGATLRQALTVRFLA